MDETTTYDYLQVISEGTYIGRSQMGTCNIFKVSDAFFLVNRMNGETRRIQSNEVLFKHVAAKHSWETPL